MVEIVKKLGEIIVEYLDIAIDILNNFLDSFSIFSFFLDVFDTSNKFLSFLNLSLFGIFIFLVIFWLRKLFSS